MNYKVKIDTKGGEEIERNYLVYLLHLIGTVLVFFIIGSPLLVEAHSIHFTETNSTLGFYGTYKSLNEPHPAPPNGSKSVVLDEKNPEFRKGSLPKMGELMTGNWIWFILTFLGIILVERQRTYRNQLRVEMNHKNK